MSFSHVEIRTSLLRETIKFAAENAPFYRYLASKSIQSLNDLYALPSVSKEMLAHSGRQMLTCRPQVNSLSLSSGTTWGDYIDGGGSPINAAALKKLAKPALFFRSPEERDLCVYLTKGQKIPGLGLRIDNGTHGPIEARNDGFREIVLPLQKPFHFAAIRTLIDDAEKLFGEKIVNISAPSNQLKNIVALNATMGDEFLKHHAVSSVLGYGSFVTSRWRDDLNAAFNSNVIDVYAISEMLGSGGPRCGLCGGYHVQPWVIPEVVDAFSGNSGGDKTGELVLTCLLPFSRVQPLIRFRTGDIVEIRECEVDFSFVPLGKSSESLFDGNGKFMLGSNEIVEALDSIGNIGRWHTPNQKALLIPDKYGPPKYAVATRGSPNYNHYADIHVFFPFTDSEAHSEVRKLSEILNGLNRSTLLQIRVLPHCIAEQFNWMPKW